MRSRTLALLPLFVLVAACSGKVSIGSNGTNSGTLQKNPDGGATGNGQTCEYGGKTVAVGEHFPSPDGCNTCTCAQEGAYCTELGCAVDAGPAPCSYDGKTYSVGTSFPSSDGCNTCSCGADGLIACTERACAVDCSAKGACGPAPGIPNIQCFDGTTAGPSCSGTAGQCSWKFTECACQGEPTHKPGDSWSDGCNSCSCATNGQIQCTAMACACPPDGTIDCMPPVPSNKTSVCSGSYHQWVVSNCPNVHFTF